MNRWELIERLCPRCRGLGTFEPCSQQVKEGDSGAFSAPQNERGKRQVRVLDEKRSDGNQEFCIENGDLCVSLGIRPKRPGKH
jgi:hypothetical protein